MIQRLYVLVLFISLFSCNNTKKTKGYNLKGSIAGLPDSKIYVQLLTDSGFRLIDSGNIHQHAFKLSGVTSEPQIISLLFGTSQEKEFLCSSFFLENEDISITGELTNRSQIKISSSTENDIMKKINQNAYLPKRYYTLQNLRFRYLQNPDHADDSIQQWSREIQQLDTAYKKQLFNAVLSYSNSYAALNSLLTNLSLFSIDELKIMGHAFPASIRQSITYAPIAKILKLAKSVNIGEKMENFYLPDSLQKQFSLSNTSKPYVLIEFWASWCAPCRKQLPELKKIYTFKNDNILDIISISMDEDTGRWKQALNEEKMPWLNLLAPEKDWCKNHYLVTYIPSNFLLDSNRTIIARNITPYEIPRYITGYNVH